MDWYRKYARNQRTLEDISEEIGITKQTLQKKFDTLCVCTGEVFHAPSQEPLVVVMDATSIGNVGMLTLLRDMNQNNLFWYWSESEKADHYQKCLLSLKHLRYSFSGFVIDGKPGIRQMLEKQYPGVPVQLCQKHQMEIVKRYLPRKAHTQAARSLRGIALRIVDSHPLQISTALQLWRSLYKDFLNEKTYNTHPTASRKWWYTHKNIRSAYHSLKRSLSHLYTRNDYPERCIPNTTNICDGYFSHLKERLNRHRGLSSERKKKMANYLLENY